MSWTAALVDSMTGVRGAQLSLAGGSWTEGPLNEPSSAKVDISVKDLFDLPQRSWMPWAASVALLWEDEPIVMGPILADPTVDVVKRTATLDVGGFEDFLEYRVATDTNYGPGQHTGLANSTASYSGVSLGNIGWKLVQAALDRPQGVLPVVDRSIPEQVERQRNYEGFNVSNNQVAKRLFELTGVINGPDIMFRPEWADGRDRLQWGYHAGTEGQPTLPQTQHHVFDVSAPNGQLAAVGVKTAWSPVHRLYGTGAGEGAGTLIRIDQLDWWEGPLLETVWSDSQIAVDNEALLLEKIAGELATGKKRIAQFTVEADLPIPALHQWHAGEWHTVVWPDGLHPLVPGGQYRAVVLKRSGDLVSRRCQVEFQAVSI